MWAKVCACAWERSACKYMLGLRCTRGTAREHTVPSTQLCWRVGFVEGRQKQQAQARRHHKGGHRCMRGSRQGFVIASMRVVTAHVPVQAQNNCVQEDDGRIKQVELRRHNEAEAVRTEARPSMLASVRCAISVGARHQQLQLPLLKLLGLPLQELLVCLRPRARVWGGMGARTRGPYCRMP